MKLRWSILVILGLWLVLQVGLPAEAPATFSESLTGISSEACEGFGEASRDIGPASRRLSRFAANRMARVQVGVHMPVASQQNSSPHPLFRLIRPAP